MTAFQVLMRRNRKTHVMPDLIRHPCLYLKVNLVIEGMDPASGAG
jgi:hypothetical protein